MSTVNPARQVFQRPAGAPSSAPVAASPLAAPPVDPFRVLRKHVTAIVASGVFGILLGVGLYVGLGAFFPAYTGIVRFEVVGNLKDANQATPSDLDRDDVVIRLARTEIAFILSRQVLTDAVNDPDVQNTTWARKFRDANGAFLVPEAVDDLIESVTATYITDTNLFEVKWSTRDRRDVPVVLNRIHRTYKTLRDQMRDQEFNNDLRTFKNQESEYLRQQASLAADINRFVSEHNIFTLADLRSHPLQLEVNGLNTQVAQTRSNLTQLGSLYQQTSLKLQGTLDPSAEDRALAENDRSVQLLIQRVTDMRIEQGLTLALYGPEHRNLREMEVRLRVAEEERDRRINEVIQRNLNAQIKQLANQIESTQQLLDELLKRQADKDAALKELAGKVAEYQALEQRRNQVQAELERTLVAIADINRLRQRAAAERVRVLTQAQEPREKSFPPEPIILIPLCTLLSVGLVTGLLFLRELTDKRVKSASDLAIVPGVRVLGVVPDLQDDPTRIDKAELALRDQPRSVIAESYRQTCTPIMRAMDRNGHQTLVVAGGLPGAGTTTVVTNLAAFISAGGRRVLAIDANFRRPGLVKALGGSATDQAGLGDVLNGSQQPASVIQSIGGGIDVMGPGTPGSRVFERLVDGRFESLLAELRTRYDFIVIDAPPAVVAGEALVLAGKTDASVLVVRANQEQRGLVARLVSQFNGASSELLGVVLNRPRFTAGGYFKRNYAAIASYSSKAGS